MITGRQIREARASLGWAQWRLARQVYLPIKRIAEAESCDDVPRLSLRRLARIQVALERAGVEFKNRPGSVRPVRSRADAACSSSQGSATRTGDLT